MVTDSEKSKADTIIELLLSMSVDELAALHAKAEAQTERYAVASRDAGGPLSSVPAGATGNAYYMAGEAMASLRRTAFYISHVRQAEANGVTGVEL